jgi:putative ABC transport system substrate-binding protein
MRRRKFIALIGGAAAWPLSVNAQMLAIGFLSSRSARDSDKVVEAFGKGLGEVGFTEGNNLTIEYRYADGALNRLPEMAAELVKRPISALVAVGGSNSAMAAKRASSIIPIVFVIGGDPVRLGLAASLSRPGGNATGMTIISADLAPKRLGLVVESNTTYYSIPYLTVACTKAGAIAATATALAIKKRFMASSKSFYCLNACNAS